MVKQKWIQNSDYDYTWEQLKSIRLDLTVQRIKNEFTIDVYETHARIALEVKDLAEYNQCQSRLVELFDEGLPGNVMEFTAYRILWSILQSSNFDIIALLQSLSKEALQNDAVKHALAVWRAYSECNYHRLSKLYRTAPYMSHFLIDFFMPKVRDKALPIIIKAYSPYLVEIELIEKELSFSSKKECIKFLEEKNVVFDDTGTAVNTKKHCPYFLRYWNNKSRNSLYYTSLNSENSSMKKIYLRHFIKNQPKIG